MLIFKKQTTHVELIPILVFVEQLTVLKNNCGLFYLLSFILLTNGVTLFYLQSTVDRTFILKAVTGYPHSQWILELVVVQTMAGCILVTRCWTFRAVQDQLEPFFATPTRFSGGWRGTIQWQKASCPSAGRQHVAWALSLFGDGSPVNGSSDVAD